VFPAYLFLPSHEFDQISRGLSSTAGEEEKKKLTVVMIIKSSGPSMYIDGAMLDGAKVCSEC